MKSLITLAFICAVSADVSHLTGVLKDDGYHYDHPSVGFPNSNNINNNDQGIVINRPTSQSTTIGNSQNQYPTGQTQYQPNNYPSTTKPQYLPPYTTSKPYSSQQPSQNPIFSTPSQPQGFNQINNRPTQNSQYLPPIMGSSRPTAGSSYPTTTETSVIGYQSTLQPSYSTTIGQGYPGTSTSSGYESAPTNYQQNSSPKYPQPTQYSSTPGIQQSTGISINGYSQQNHLGHHTDHDNTQNYQPSTQPSYTTPLQNSNQFTGDSSQAQAGYPRPTQGYQQPNGYSQTSTLGYQQQNTPSIFNEKQSSPAYQQPSYPSSGNYPQNNEGYPTGPGNYQNPTTPSRYQPSTISNVQTTFPSSQPSYQNGGVSVTSSGYSPEPAPAHSFGPDGYNYKIPSNSFNF